MSENIDSILDMKKRFVFLFAVSVRYEKRRFVDFDMAPPSVVVRYD